MLSADCCSLAMWQVVAVTGRMLKSQPSQLEALTLRGRSYFYLGGEQLPTYAGACAFADQLPHGLSQSVAEYVFCCSFHASLQQAPLLYGPHHDSSACAPPDHDLAKRHFGEALKYDDNAADARKGFNKVKEFDRKRSRADKALAANEWAEAEEALVAALAVDPQHKLANVGLWLGLCQAQRHGGKAQEAVQVGGGQSCSGAMDRASKLLPVGLLKVAHWSECKMPTCRGEQRITVQKTLLAMSCSCLATLR